MPNSGYDFYLDKCLLPITPQKLQIKINSANKTVTLVNEGEINILKTPKLTDVEFECIIPQMKYPFSSYKSGFKEPLYFFDYFEKLKKDKKPFQFIVSRALPNGKALVSTDRKVSMEDYQIMESAENGFDYTVKIKLKYYRDYCTKEVSILNMEAGMKVSVQKTRAAETSPVPANNQTYTVVKGDCLWNIAKKIYGDGAKYTVIYDANRDVVSGSPNLIYPGQVLIIPAV